MTQEVPAVSSIVDMLTVRIEALEASGDRDELNALKAAREELVNYSVRERQMVEMILEIMDRVGGPVR